MRFYLIQVTDKPTFYLNADIQGITGADHAEGIARKMFNLDNDDAASITVERLDLEIKHTEV